MVRTVKDKYNVWLTGYYDDFTGARAIADDTNSPNDSVNYLSYKSHFGNPLNGEATLNPRYRWCILDRIRNNSTLPSASFFSSATDKLLHNKGLYEWISLDLTRNSPSTQQGRSQLEYPDGFTNANRFRTNPQSTSGIYGNDAYQLFCNGNDTSTRYIVPTGTIDGSFARNTMVGYGDSTTIANKTAGKNNITDTHITLARRAHLAGHWMGETINTGSSDTSARDIFHTVESLSGQPFLCVQTFNKTGSNTTPTEPSLIFDGSLNSRDTGDWLHFRLAVRSFNGTNTNNGKIIPKVTIKAGFSGTIAPTSLSSNDLFGANTHFEEGLTGTPAISFDVDLTGYNTHPLLYSMSRVKQTNIPTKDNMWIDVDVHIDYTSGAQKFKVYQDGVLKSTNPFASGVTRTASAMYGWEIYTHSPSGSDDAVTTLMLDRAALFRPLTDMPSGEELNPLHSLSINTVNNGMSNCSIELNDEAQYSSPNQVGFSSDKYNHELHSLFSGVGLKEWKVIVFAGAGQTGNKDIARIDRPIWQGIIESVNVTENLKDRTISIEALDSLSILDKQLPLWEVGQGSLNSEENTTIYWEHEAQGMSNIMHMGASKLKDLAGDLGMGVHDGYQNRADQRMQLHSGHPIQMYNNEDTYGPNNIWKEYEGMGIDFIYELSNGKVMFQMTGNPGFSAGDSVVITNTTIPQYNNTTITIDAVQTSTINGVSTQQITFNANNSGGTNILDNDYVLTNLNQIVYAGQYIGESIPADSPLYITSLSNNNAPGGGITNDILERYSNYVNLTSTHPTTSYVKEVLVTNPGENYYMDNLYYSNVETNLYGEDYTLELIPEGVLTIPASPSFIPPGFATDVSVDATAKWISNPHTGTIIGVEVLEQGFGYTASIANIVADTHILSNAVGGLSRNNNGAKTIVESPAAVSTIPTGSWSPTGSTFPLADASNFASSGTGNIGSGTETMGAGDVFTWTNKSGNNLLGVQGLSQTYGAGTKVYNKKGGAIPYGIYNTSGGFIPPSGYHIVSTANLSSSNSYLNKVKALVTISFQVALDGAISSGATTLNLKDESTQSGGSWDEITTSGKGIINGNVFTWSGKTLRSGTGPTLTGVEGISSSHADNSIVYNNSLGLVSSIVPLISDVSVNGVEHEGFVYHGRDLSVNQELTLFFDDISNSVLIAKVGTLTDDATFSIVMGGEAYSDTVTLCVDTDPNLLAGDGFMYQETKHIVKSVKKIYNYHNYSTNPAYNTFLWQIQTFTPYEGDFAVERGTWISDSGLLTGSNRLSYSTNIGGTLSPVPTSQTEDISSRAIHARWMQDLPLSLWFKYHFGEIKYTALTSCDIPENISANATSIEVTSACYNAAPNHGIGQIVRPIKSASYKSQKNINDFFIYRHKFELNSKYYLGGVKYVSVAHTSTGNNWQSGSYNSSASTKVYILDHKNTYKHIWLLWADMRHDGTADADGGLRKKKFGLTYPKSKNYKIELKFEDQFDRDGKSAIFTELNETEDYDIWEIDSTTDSSSAGAFSYPVDYTNQQSATLLDENGGTNANGTLKVRITKSSHGLSANTYVNIWNANVAGHNGTFKITDASNAGYFIIDKIYLGADAGAGGGIKYAPTYGTSADLTTYQNWHEKGGSLIVVDTSKFFNLNTLANNGSQGQEVGGSTTLADYVAVGKGDVALIDNYYEKAPSSHLTTGPNYRYHTNIEKIVSDSSEFNSDIIKGQFWLEPEDLSIFQQHGVGKIAGTSEDFTTTYYYNWVSKLNTKVNRSVTNVGVVSVGDTHWVLTDSGATFVDTGVKKGMYIKNKSKPLVEGVGDSWKANFVQDFYYRISKVVSNTVIWVERVAYLPYISDSVQPTTIAQLSALTDENIPNRLLGLRSVYLSANDITDGWINGAGYLIPAQLANVNIESATNVTTNTEYNSSQIEDAFTNFISQKNIVRGIVMGYSNIELTNSDYIDVRIYSSGASPYAYRLMMNLVGSIESKNNGTYYHSDKIRALWSTGIADTWWNKTKLPCMYDINNIPITTLMTTYNNINSNDSYGGTFKSNNKTLLNSIKGIQKIAGQGQTNDISTSFSYLMGRDNKIEFRPKYNSGYSINRNNVKVSNMDIQTNNNISNVRVYYNQNTAFVDWPTPNLSDTTSWHIESSDDIRTEIEALLLAKELYRTKQENNISLTISPIRGLGEDDIMLDGGRFGYVSDPQIAFKGDDISQTTAWCWTRYGTGGLMFPGMVNALDGNLGVAPTTTLYNRVGTGATPSYSATLAHTSNYYWYGSNSISKAVQIVHVSKNTPKLSSTTGEKIRMFVAIKAGQAATTLINDLQFTICFADYSFNISSATTPTNAAPLLTATLASNGVTNHNVKHNGFYEITLPSSYGTGKVVFSFNADYCRDLLRSRCGSSNVHLNAHDLTGIDLGSSFNTSSIFPLGGRKYTEFTGGFANKNEYYAPQLNIVNDLNYIPATYVSYTDASHGLTDEILVVQSIDWEIKAGEIETLSLSLEKDESKSAKGIVPYILNNLPTHNYHTVSAEQIGVAPPPITIVEDIAEQEGIVNDNSPTEGFDANGVNIAERIEANNLSQGLYNNLVGTMSLGASPLTAQSSTGILGQDIVPPTPSMLRTVDSNITGKVISGSATVDNSKFSLPGKGKTQVITDLGDNTNPEKVRDIEHAIQFDISTPSNAINNEINITATLDMKTSMSGQTGVLDVYVLCLETNASIRESFTVVNGKQNNIELVSTQTLLGVNVPGNNIKVIVSRRAGQGNDTANFNSININNLNVNFRRAAVNADDISSDFIPYS